MQRKIRAKIKELGSAVVSRQSLERRREKVGDHFVPVEKRRRLYPGSRE